MDEKLLTRAGYFQARIKEVEARQQEAVKKGNPAKLRIYETELDMLKKLVNIVGLSRDVS